MTKDEMIKGLRYKAENIKAHMEPEFFAEVADYLESQKAEQCDDAISRKWVLNVVNNFVFDTETDRNRIIHIIRDTAPSVIPTREK